MKKLFALTIILTLTTTGLLNADIYLKRNRKAGLININRDPDIQYIKLSWPKWSFTCFVEPGIGETKRYKHVYDEVGERIEFGNATHIMNYFYLHGWKMISYNSEDDSAIFERI